MSEIEAVVGGLLIDWVSLTADSRRAAANIGSTILGRGEFSLVLATLATSAGLDPRIGPFVALYVLVLAIAGPVLAARSRALARLVPRRLVGQR